MDYFKIAALTSGRDVPSTRFRIRQYRSTLAAYNIELKEYCPIVSLTATLPGPLSKIRRRYLPPWVIVQTLMNIAARCPAFIGARFAELCLISRSVIPGLEGAIHFLPRPRVLDVDDAIWLTTPLGSSAAARLASNVDAVIAGNEYLARWYRQYNDQVFVVPTAVNCEKYFPKPKAEQFQEDSITIGWIGSSGNFPQLELVRSVLEEFLSRWQDARVLIIADKPPPLWAFDGKRVVFHRWSKKTEVASLQEVDIGIMPLLDNEWNRGKCSFKMLQYLAVGIPVVVSPVGMNKEVLDAGNVGFGPSDSNEWMEALVRLYLYARERLSKGNAGRLLVEQHFSTRVVTKKLARIFRSVLA